MARAPPSFDRLRIHIQTMSNMEGLHATATPRKNDCRVVIYRPRRHTHAKWDRALRRECVRSAAWLHGTNATVL